ncbi:cobyrinate a,c-diamide synthase [Sulfodiicoccus acidiphilus]|nr:cobyrinate a,c-diamide synthase [Sulfodiicoccus acidiphilus]
MLLPRVIIAADRSGSGKTTATAALMRKLSKTKKVRGFKAGPDYIDPGYHRVATGTPAANLDLWMMGEKGVMNSLAKYGKGFDISVIEGVMGLYDGAGGKYSTFELAKVTGTPIVAVIDASGMSTTAGAVVKGLIDYRGAEVKGVIFNKVSSERHYLECASSLPEGVKPLGYLPKRAEIQVEERHLGLLTVEDNSRAERIVKTAEESLILDVDDLVNIATTARDLPDAPEENREQKGRAAVAYDSAFSFYYLQNLDAIRSKYEIEFFSPLNNEVPKEVDFIYLGGGYPELHLSELEAATATKTWLLEQINMGTKVFGECGGLMFLGKRLLRDGRDYRMVGALDVEIETKSKLTIGYTELEAVKDNLISREGSRIRGHEFHVSKVVSYNERPVFRNRLGKGLGDGWDGLQVQNALGTYSHFLFANLPKFLS